MPAEFTVRVEARFEARITSASTAGSPASARPLVQGRGDLAARGGGVDCDAIAVDSSARRKLEQLAKRLDYGCINDVAPFDRINPSAENIADGSPAAPGRRWTGRTRGRGHDGLGRSGQHVTYRPASARSMWI